ncbi:MAG TPA: diaminopimelate decarboxylase [Acidimicrobiia bacterium]|nr:diaminopimelate decarboxylase [Acidimicrobiia bacterium]
MTGPIDLSLLPRTADVADDGRLRIGGCDLADLAEEYGTPLFVYDETELRECCREYAGEFGAGDVAYASKAFLCRAMVRLVGEEGLLLDVATGGELHIALSGGFPSERIVFHGNNKSTEELERALRSGVGRIVLDSFDEIDRVEALVATGLPAPSVLVRVTPGVAADTHRHIETGVEDTKFGFTVAGGIALEACRRAASSGAMHFAGIHTHIGSQISTVEPYALATSVVGALLADVEAVTGQPVEELNLGGGVAVRYTADAPVLAVADYARALREALDTACAHPGVSSRPRLMVEPGRSIAARAGVTLYRVGTIKEIPGVRTYVAVDGGMSDNPRPATYGARYEAFVPTRAGAPRPRRATVAGKHCEQGDVVVHDADLPDDLAVGDLVCTPVTGAYGYSMASNYNAVTRPAVVFVRDGAARLVMRRETLDDLLRLDEG